MMTKSHEAPILKVFSSGMVMVTLVGSWSNSMTCEEMPSPIPHIC